MASIEAIERLNKTYSQVRRNSMKNVLNVYEISPSKIQVQVKKRVSNNNLSTILVPE